MSQADIIKLLEKCEEALSAVEIHEKLNNKMNISAITRALKQLTKYDELQAIEIELPIARRIYGKKVKCNMNLYYLPKK